MKLSVCIPMYNEAAGVAASVKALSEYCKKNFEDYEIIYINDGSKDGCDEILRKLDIENVRLISYSPNRGKGYAVRRGMLEATGDFRLFTDTDLAYGCDVIKEIFSMYQKEKENGVDIIIGSRKLAGGGYESYTFMRRAASKVYLKLLQTLGGFSLSDSQCGFKGFSANAAEELFSLCETDRFAFDFEILSFASRLGYKIAEMPVKIINHGESKINLLRDSTKMFADIIKIRSRVNKKVKALKKAGRA